MSEASATPPRAHDAVVALHLPDDWLDLALDDERVLRELVAARLPPAVREQVVQGLLRWRARPGVLSHGVIEVHHDGLDASWHVLTSLVPVPAHPGIDAAGVLARLLRSQHPTTSTEVFDTVQGSAVGWLREQPVPGGRAGGMAVVLGLPDGSPLGLLVVGVCRDVGQLHDLACLVTVIASRSLITTAPA